MELQKRPVRYYETVLNAGVNKEDTVDLIVPDLYPDIGRILDAQGMICVKERNIRDGMAEIIGVCKVGILYMPDDESARVRKMDVSIPFDHQFESKKLEQSCQLTAGAILLSCEARTINPRKVQVGIGLRVECTAYKQAEWDLCGGVDADPAHGLQLRTDTYTAWLPIAVHSREFTISDELEIPGSRPPVEEILTASVRLAARDPRPLGNKAVFKGEAMIKLLYTGTDEQGDGINVTEQELPFSQILEMEGLEDGADIQIQLSLAGLELEPRGDGQESRRVGVTLHINAMARACSDKHLEAVSDAYSTCRDIRPELRAVQHDKLVERGTRRQNVRDVLETEAAVQNVLDCRVTLCPVEGSPDVEARAAVLYRDENGQIRVASKKIPVPCAAELPPEATLTAVAALAGEITAAAMSDGLELRFTVDFDITVTVQGRMMTLCGLTGDMETPLDNSKAPSVVLRRYDAGDTLWEMAKTYHTTCDELLLANALESSEGLASGMLMLIPKAKR